MSVEAQAQPSGDLSRAAGASRLIWRSWSTRSLLLYGLVVAVIGMAALDLSAPSPWPIEGSRAASLRGALAELDHGGAPLWGRYTTHVLESQRGPGGFYYGPTSPGDDQGAFFYVPGLAHVLGMRDPLEAMRVFYLILFFAPLLLYPLLFERLFNSTAAGLVAPWLLLFSLGVLRFHDVMWISEWAVFALLPPMMLLDRRWPRWGLAWLALLLVGASFATSVRSQAGLGIAAAALIVLLRRPWRWRWRLASIPVLLVAYLSISTFGLAAVRAWRADVLGHSVHDASGSHLTWHPLYLGLGYLPNRYGLRWNDSIAIDRVHAYRPNVKYPSASYDAAVRHLFVQLVKRDPGLLVRSVGAKVLVVLLFSAIPLALLALLAVAMAAWRDRAPPLPRYLLLVTPTLLFGLPPPLLGVPYIDYDLAWLAGIALCCILALAWLAAHLYAPGEARSRLGELIAASLAWVRRSRVRAVAAAATIVLLIAAALAGLAIQRHAAHWQKSAAPVGVAASLVPDSVTERARI